MKAKNKRDIGCQGHADINKSTPRDYLEINISAVSGLYFQSIGNTFEDW